MSQNNIDLSTIPANVPSLCIPRVFSNIDERRIRRILGELNMGEIDRIDIVPRQTEKGEKFNRVFIHWRRWNTTENAGLARQRLLNGKEIKIIYDDPWFWKISAYRQPAKREDQPRHQKGSRRPAPVRLEFDEEPRKQRRGLSIDIDLANDPVDTEQTPEQPQAPRQQKVRHDT